MNNFTCNCEERERLRVDNNAKSLKFDIFFCFVENHGKQQYFKYRHADIMFFWYSPRQLQRVLFPIGDGIGIKNAVIDLMCNVLAACYICLSFVKRNQWKNDWYKIWYKISEQKVIEEKILLLLSLLEPSTEYILAK